MTKDVTGECITATWVEEADFPLRDRFAMQYMDQRWEHLRIGMKYLEEDHVEASWRSAYAYADLAMQAREPKKEKDDDGGHD